jgi:hypothetical protein
LLKSGPLSSQFGGEEGIVNSALPTMIGAARAILQKKALKLDFKNFSSQLEGGSTFMSRLEMSAMADVEQVRLVRSKFSDGSKRPIEIVDGQLSPQKQ